MAEPAFGPSYAELQAQLHTANEQVKQVEKENRDLKGRFTRSEMECATGITYRNQLKENVKRLAARVERLKALLSDHQEDFQGWDDKRELQQLLSEPPDESFPSNSVH